MSGGRRITGWRVRDGVWTADVGGLDTRQLYVDGRRAERAHIAGLPGEARATGTGYVTGSPEPREWRSPADVEFVYRGVYPWTEARCGVAGVSADGGSTVITMAQPAYGWAGELYNSTWEGQTSHGPGLPTRIENDAAFLREPGTFVLDRSRPGRHVLLYLPRPGEDPERTPVVAPVLETLLSAAGARDLAFRGLTFADATWLRPGRPEGFVHYHGGDYYEGGGVETAVLGEGASVTYPARSAAIPACVSFRDVAGVEIEGCRFTRLGAYGLGVSGGDGVTVRGCDLDTLAGGGITVSGGRDATIEDTWVHHAGLDYSGSPGISVRGVHGCVIASSEVADVPHCGIVAGPGTGVRVLRNLVADTMRVLADGGGVYVSGAAGVLAGRRGAGAGQRRGGRAHAVQLRALHRLRDRLADGGGQPGTAGGQHRRAHGGAAAGERRLPGELLGRRPRRARRPARRRDLRGERDRRRRAGTGRGHGRHPGAGRARAPAPRLADGGVPEGVTA
ncbi:right-handed parallel beta-helix repeat-containing protein [Planomonospora alba]|uniref:right-handed parallel beta-helix repeat-containing protein n=1 Tax=Planomonospora alba TaxID=161354 RepID=UPI0031F07D91